MAIGQNSMVYYRSKIDSPDGGHITIGNSCAIGRAAKGYHAAMPFYTTLLCDGGGNSRIRIGDNCRINGAYIHAKDFIDIGDNCVMASGITIIDSNAHEVKSRNRTQGRDAPKGIIIGNNVWIGLNAIILKGSVIGDNCIIAAGSVVKGAFPENTIIQGNPAVVSGQVVFDNNNQ